MSSDPKPSSSENKNVSINGDVSGVVVVGDNNVVNNQTFIQKFFNIFKSDSETLEHRNRRILLGHVENAWIKGVLDASLHGAALLDLGIKQDPEAVTQYPWTIKRESTDETLPAGLSMLAIFDSIGMGRSLLILGAPGSGKTTMLLELARQLIARAREDVTQPIPMVFNLASWTERLTLADWLAQELNNLYSVPRKAAPDWVKGNKLLLLLDGLDEVRQDSRTKCVEAINAFRKEHGLTSLAVCSRSKDYADLNAKFSFEGAIEVQPLTQKQITNFFNRFGDEMAGIKQLLKKDSALREMAETPLFLSIMIIAYRDKRNVDILAAGDEQARRKHLFDTYIERIFQRPRSKNTAFNKENTIQWLTWLARKMMIFNRYPFFVEDLQPIWLEEEGLQDVYRNVSRVLREIIVWISMGMAFGYISFKYVPLIRGLYFDYKYLLSTPIIGVFIGLFIGLTRGYTDKIRSYFMFDQKIKNFFGKKSFRFLPEIVKQGILDGGFIGLIFGVTFALTVGVTILLTGEFFNSIFGFSVILLVGVVFFGFFGIVASIVMDGLLGTGWFASIFFSKSNDIEPINNISWSWLDALRGFVIGIFSGPIFYPLFMVLSDTFIIPKMFDLSEPIQWIIIVELVSGLIVGFSLGIKGKKIQTIAFPGEGLKTSLRISILVFLLSTSFIGLLFFPVSDSLYGLVFPSLIGGVFFGSITGGFTVIQHYILRVLISINNMLPYHTVSFLDHCVDLIFLRRVGGGYIFVHRLLMEHFAEMYVESPNSKGN